MNAAATIRIGKTSVMVTRPGLGCAPLGGLYEAVPDEQARATVDRAWELGLPSGLWDDLRAEGLLPNDAPVPA